MATKKKSKKELLRQRTDKRLTEDALRKLTDDLMKADAPLMEQSRILEAFFDSTITPLVFLDRNFNFVRVNQAYAKACQRDISDFKGHNHFEFYPSDARKIFEQVAETRVPYQAFARPLTFPDHPEWGTTYWNWTLTPILNDRGETEFLVFSLEDVTERKRAEEILQESGRQLRYLSSQLMAAQENERRRIARELHDGLGQLLTAIKFKVESFLQEMGQSKMKTKAEPLEAIIPMIQECVRESHRIQMNLRPSMLDDLGILVTISWLCREFEATYPRIRIERDIDIQEEEEIHESLKLVICRILQEGLNNISKHSQADRVVLSLQKIGHTIEFSVRDNGKGFDLQETLSMEGSKRGMGLSSMKERAKYSGGSFSVESAKGKGTHIRVSWPL